MFRLKPLICSVANGFIKQHTPSNVIKQLQKRHIFNPLNYQIKEFIEEKENVLGKVKSPDKFKQNLANLLEKKDTLIILEDIKRMMYLAESDEDLDILKNMLKRYAEQDKIIRFQEFKIGAVLMRLFYTLNKPKEALDLVETFKSSTLFKEITTFSILAGLLYKNEMYEDVIKVFHLVKEQQIRGRFFISCVTELYFASCYKINTPEIYKEAVEVWNLLQNTGVRLRSSQLWLFAVFTLNQGQPGAALNLVSSVMRHPIGVNIKLRALAKLDRKDDVLEFLKSLLFKINTNEALILSETYELLKEAGKDDPQYLIKLQKLEKDFTVNGFVNNQTIDEIILKEDPVKSDVRKMQNYRRPLNLRGNSHSIPAPDHTKTRASYAAQKP